MARSYKSSECNLSNCSNNFNQVWNKDLPTMITRIIMTLITVQDCMIFIKHKVNISNHNNKVNS